MFRFLPALTALLFLSLFATNAKADTDWAKYKTFVNTRCEDPKTISAMVEGAKSFPIFRDLQGLSLVSSRTVRATSSSLACRVQLSVVYHGTGIIRSGTFVVHIFPNGAWNAHFD
jgi:hypothetical protein